MNATKIQAYDNLLGALGEGREKAVVEPLAKDQARRDG